ncbi:MAG: hydrogenase maturation protease [Desulfobacteraceae bacterium]
MTAEIYKKNILVFGCGNTLFGNDGFGPEVVRHYKEHCKCPESALILDAGTGIRDYMFDLLLLEDRPEHLFVIDAVTAEDRTEGEIFEMKVPDVPREKLSDFSLHQSPSSSLLGELESLGVNVRIFCVHTDTVPNEIDPGLSEKVRNAVEKTCRVLERELCRL